MRRAVGVVVVVVVGVVKCRSICRSQKVQVRFCVLKKTGGVLI